MFGNQKKRDPKVPQRIETTSLFSEVPSAECSVCRSSCSAEPGLALLAADHRVACIRAEEVAGRSAADIFGVSTAPVGQPPVAAEDSTEIPIS